MLALFLSSSAMLEKGISLLGSIRLECLDQMWWKLHKIRASLGTTCDPVVVDSSSEDDLSDSPPLPPPEKRSKLATAGNTQEHQGACNPSQGVKRPPDTGPELEDGKRQCTWSTQNPALTVQIPSPIGSLSPDPNAPLTARYPPGRTFWFKKMDVPSVCILIKWKSKEWEVIPVMKAREVIMYNKHPLRRVAVLTGRCLTMLW